MMTSAALRFPAAAAALLSVVVGSMTKIRGKEINYFHKFYEEVGVMTLRAMMTLWFRKGSEK